MLKESSDIVSKKLAENQLNRELHVHPQFFDLAKANQKSDFEALLIEHNQIILHDEIYDQLKELIKLRHPKKKFSDESLAQAISDHIDGIPMENYGNWVYYPWLNKAVHVLPEKEFVEVRTNRNQYKITPEEEELLAQKKIGVIGLSVGKAIALTIALERICGELVLADFDVIELSNLNRIQTGVQNFGVKKTVVVAREIAEIDPYLKVTCFHEGLTEENVDDFFTAGGKLDVCIEVCDGLHTKIFARQKAKELKIPVVMNSSDRGTTDIERFDLEPDLPLLHGLVDHLDLSLVKQAKTNEEKVPYLLPMLGVETSSERLKASMLEIEETITTWPQLASGVVFGGGICTDVCRRILLNQFTKSGRYFVDCEQEINDEVVDYIKSSSLEKGKVRELTQEKDNEGQFLFQLDIEREGHDFIQLGKAEVEELVAAGIAAPTAGNIQPWKWLYKAGQLYLIHDHKRGKSVLNYKDTASLLGLGAAAENVVLRAHEMGLDVKLNTFPMSNNPNVYAIFQFTKTNRIDSEKRDAHGLVELISSRVTNRTLGERIPLKQDVEPYLRTLAQEIDGGDLKLFTDENTIDQLKEIIAEIDWIIMTNKSCHAQFMHEIRWNRKEVEATRDGLDIDTFDITPTERAGLVVAKNWNVTKHIKKWGLGKEFGKMSRKAIDASSAIGLITMPKEYPKAYFDGGRAIQKVWLGATQKGLSFQPMSLSTFLSERIADDNFDQLEDVKDHIIRLFNKLNNICQIEEGRTDIFLFRLAYASDPEVRPLRRDLKEVLSYD